MVGPPSSAIARLTVATSASREFRGSWTAVTRSPRACKSGITFDHDEPSAHAPWTRMTLGALVMLSFFLLRPLLSHPRGAPLVAPPPGKRNDPPLAQASFGRDQV